LFAASDPTKATTSTPDDYHIGEGGRRGRVVHRIHQLRLLGSLQVGSLRDEVQQHAEADRREVDPPINCGNGPVIEGRPARLWVKEWQE
jgi:hypothetical protein